MTDRFDIVMEDGVRVVGTLVVPASNDPTPAALLLNGSGPLDRDSNMPGQALDIANSLASALAARGVASLRYDKRGVGESNGDYLTTSFDRETSDAASMLLALRRVPAIDPRRVTLIGHSVGATIAIRLARAHDWVAGAVLLCASRSPGAEVMRIQSDRIAASLRGVQRLGVRRFLRRQEEARHALLASNGDVIDIEGRLPARWFREYMAYDPALDLAAIRCPVLAITGRSDLQVDPDDVERIGALVAGRFIGSVPDDLTHVLRRHPGRPSMSYRAQLRRPVDAALLAAVTTWVADR